MLYVNSHINGCWPARSGSWPWSPSADAQRQIIPQLRSGRLPSRRTGWRALRPLVRSSQML